MPAVPKELPSGCPLSQEQLEDAADWFSYNQAHSLWVMEQLLLHNHDRVAGLVVEEPFTPFAVFGQQLRSPEPTASTISLAMGTGIT